MKFNIGKAIDVGIQRKGKANQDSLEVILPGIFNHNPPLLVVADGMGGYTGGALASKIVTKTLTDYYRHVKAGVDYCEVLKEGIKAAHQEVMDQAQKDSELVKMGSTVVAAILEDDMMHLANVGDSRAYVVNEHEIRHVSWDHSFVGELVRQNLITPTESLSHPKRNVLTMSISGQRSDLDIFTAHVELEENDIVVLCSDGLWGPVAESQIQVVVWELAPQQAANKLIEMANRNQGPDNISVIIARQKTNRPPVQSNYKKEDEDTKP